MEQLMRQCDLCQGRQLVWQAAKDDGHLVHYPITMNLVAAWPSSTPQWREEFMAGLIQVTCPQCHGTGQIKDEPVHPTPGEE